MNDQPFQKPATTSRRKHLTESEDQSEINRRLIDLEMAAHSASPVATATGDSGQAGSGVNQSPTDLSRAGAEEE